MIVLKTATEIEILRANGAILASVLDRVCQEVSLGQNTGELDRLAERLIRESGSEPAFKGMYGFPATICTSINEEIVHGIPSLKRQLKKGDILSIDIGLYRSGMYVDMATTVPVGEVDEKAAKLMQVTEEALWRGIGMVNIGNRLADVSHAIGSCIEDAGLYVVREYTGHGIGRDLHEDPQILNYGESGQGPRLQIGMVLALEPMAKTVPGTVEVLADSWTVAADQGALAAHFEHTVALTKNGVEVLTRGGL